MAEIYDIKAFDNVDGIVFRVKYDFGEQTEPANMKFYIEVLEEHVKILDELITNAGYAHEVEYEERDWIDVDERATISVEYKSLRVKSLIRQLAEANDISIFNGDISEEYLWILEHGHEYGSIMKNPVSFDVESDPTNMNSKWASLDPNVKFGNRIYGIGFKDLNSGNERFFTDKNESLMLQKAYAYALNFTCLFGWSSGSFDIPMLQGRSELLGLKLKWKNLPHIDAMWAYEQFKEKTKEFGEVVYKSLDYVSNLYLGEGKVDIGGYANLKKIWEAEDYLLLEIYCMQDVRLTYDLVNKIEEMKNVMDIEASKIQLGYLNACRATRDSGEVYPTSFVDSVLTMLSHNRQISVPMEKAWQHRDAEDVVLPKGVGGWVPEPDKGLHFNVVSIDYLSLYPTMYITHNVGVNTVDWNKEYDDSIKTEELWFRPEPKALNAEFMEYLLETRKKYRELRDGYEKGTPEYNDYHIKQSAFKDLLVSANGAMEEKHFRYKNQPIYNSITKTGHVYLRYLKEAGELLGWKMIGADTDGGHFTTPYGSIEEIVEALPEVEAFIYDYIRKKAIEKWNVPENLYDITPRCEQISSHVYYIAKKHYVRKIVWEDGKYLSEPRFDAKGLPAVKYNTLPLLKEILKNIFKKGVFSVAPGEDYIPKTVDYLLGVRDDLISGRRDDWLTFGQRVHTLGGRLPHDRAAEELNKRGLFESGMIVRFIRRRNGNVVLPDYDKDVDIDRGTYVYYWTGTVAKWITKLLPEVAGFKELGFKAARPTKKLGW